MAIEYDDKWIAERWECTHNWLTLCREYNSAHGTSIGYNTFKSHCNRELSLNYHYSDEQEKWLKENYPKLGRVECSRLFNEKFGTTKSVNAVKIKCISMGLKVSEARLKAKAIENTKRYHEIGTVKVMGNNGLCEKTENGWERVADKVIGKAPKGHRIVHLDGNILNNDIENLQIASFTTCGYMTANNLWSEHPKITESGLIWCKLAEALDGEREQNND